MLRCGSRLNVGVDTPTSSTNAGRTVAPSPRMILIGLLSHVSLKSPQTTNFACESAARIESTTLRIALTSPMRIDSVSFGPPPLLLR